MNRQTNELLRPWRFGEPVTGFFLLHIGLAGLLFVIWSTDLQAAPLHIQTQFAVVSESDFGPALAFQYDRPIKSTNLIALSAGGEITDNLFGLPAEVVAYGVFSISMNADYSPIYTVRRYTSKLTKR